MVFKQPAIIILLPLTQGYLYPICIFLMHRWCELPIAVANPLYWLIAAINSHQLLLTVSYKSFDGLIPVMSEDDDMRQPGDWMAPIDDRILELMRDGDILPVVNDGASHNSGIPAMP